MISRLEGEGLEKLAWLLDLGTLMNIGKGAAYGSGCYQVSHVDSA